MGVNTDLDLKDLLRQLENEDKTEQGTPLTDCRKRPPPYRGQGPRQKHFALDA